MQVTGFGDKVAFIWQVADLLRGDYKAHEYGQIILPFTVLRRLDCVLEPTKDAVMQRAADLAGKIENVEPLLLKAAGQPFYNISALSFTRLLDDASNIAPNLRTYIQGFSSGAVEVLDKYGFDNTITRLDNAGLLFQVVGAFAQIDLHPNRVPNNAMGYIFEELLRKFSEMSNETAGEHFTPREVIRLMVNILFSDDDDALRGTAPVRTMFDCACGTGGMLTGGQEHLNTLNPRARLEVFGQELNAETWAIARSDMMIKGQDPSHIRLGNSLSDDQFSGQRFDYMIANPPFGVDWKRIQQQIEDEAAQLGDRGRFAAGLPQVGDGSLLFLQHLISKMKAPEDGGSRLAIVFSGRPLFSGGAGSGESEIRRWLIENDWLEAIVALPGQLFYNTSIGTYFWIVSNRKRDDRKGVVTLLDARRMYTKMRKGLGEKRKYISAEQISAITELYDKSTLTDEADARVKVIPNDAFGYQRVTIEQPMRRVWCVDEDTAFIIENSKHVDEFLGAHEDKKASLDSALRALQNVKHSSEAVFSKELQRVLAQHDLDLPKAVLKAIVAAVAIRDEDAPIILDRKKSPIPDADLRDTENAPLLADLDKFFEETVKPHVPDAWLDHSKDRVGYELPFLRLFPLAPAEESLDSLEQAICDKGKELDTISVALRSFSADFVRRAADERWPVLPLKRLARIVNGGTPPPDNRFWGGDVPWATPVDLNRSNGLLVQTERAITRAGLAAGSRVVPAGAVLVSSRAPIGTVAVAMERMAFNQGCKGLVPDARISSDCLAFQLAGLKRELEARGQGSTFLELRAENLATVPLYLPNVTAQKDLDFRSALDGYQQARRVSESLIELHRLRRKALDNLLWEATYAAQTSVTK